MPIPIGRPRPLKPMPYQPNPIVMRPIFYDAENDKIVDRSEPLEKEQTFKSDILKKK